MPDGIYSTVTGTTFKLNGTGWYAKYFELAEDFLFSGDTLSGWTWDEPDSGLLLPLAFVFGGR